MPTWQEEFERVRPWIERALRFADGTHSIEDVRERISTGHAQLWPGKQAAVVTEIIEHPQRKTCNCWLAGSERGAGAEIEAIYDAIEPWAQAAGCKRVTIIGRRGWQRTRVAERGFKPKWVTLSKDI